MKVIESWLRELVNPNIDSMTLCDQLTMLGLEIDAATPLAPAFTGVVVGEVMSAVQHPDADRLRVCQVNIGAKELLNIVCGAPNARAGIRVAVATVGAVLPGDFKIKEAKLRGVLSQGMLCAENEMGLPKTMEGILELAPHAPIGADIRAYLNLDDVVIDISLTPNRGDCLSVLGLAREVALKNNMAIVMPNITSVAAALADTVNVAVMAPEACPRYGARVLKGVNNQAKTPEKISTYLNHAGVRSISAVVDILNYVMLLLGQPMHGFDFQKIEGDVQVRFAKDQETLDLLNDMKVTLTPNILVIADSAKALAMAGVMGGKNSEVDVTTSQVLLESAFFAPDFIAGRARQFGLHTDASHRFERGVDPALPVRALELATELILEICGGAAGPVVDVANSAHLPVSATITLSYAHLEKLLGVSIAATEISKILSAVGCEILVEDSKSIAVKAPSWRFDLNIPEDLIEEVARVYGYDNIEPQVPVFPLAVRSHKEIDNAQETLKNFLCARGLREVISFSFIDAKEHEYFKEGRSAQVLQNPISSDLSEMRLSVIPSLLKILQYNERRQVDCVRIFELGRIYDAKETPVLAGLLYGAREPQSWLTAERLDFYDAKGLLEALFAFLHIENIQFKNQDLPSFIHPGQGVSIWVGGQCVGYVGALHPACQSAFEVKLVPFVFEVQLAALSQAQFPAVVNISKFPSIRRDLALVVPEIHSAQAVLDVIAAVPSDLLSDAFVFDVYQGEHVAKNHQSLAIALILQHTDHTLVDTEVEHYVQQVIQALQEKLSVVLRA